ncbi:MAG: prolyl oligopeptidase family serine peptidase [Candidatus Edwardsbacteria bacterium]|nr:prolyl oligopeptidase family serine peptidase [Candidatus Edwardsbacteria bacterium]
MIIKPTAAQTDDPYLWLEDINGKPSMDWVNQHNATTIDLLLKQPEYQQTYDQYLEVLNSADKIARPDIRGDYIYNFWKDKDHERGIWRRASKQSYLDGSPQWEILLDMDQLSKTESVNWAFRDDEGLFPCYSRFLVHLSRGGGDATVIREYDPAKKSFIDEGFSLPECKGDVSYLDRNTLLVSRDFGEGTLTTSGYPRQVRLWKRGTDIKDAPVIHQGENTDVSVSAQVYHRPERNYIFIIQRRTFFTEYTYAYEGGRLIKLDIPDDANILDILQGQLVIKLRTDWRAGRKTFRQGSAVSADYDALLTNQRQPELIVHPDDSSTVKSVAATRNKLLVSMLKNVKSRLYVYSHEKQKWKKTPISIPGIGSTYFGSTDNLSDEYFYYYEDFLTPSSLFFADAGTKKQKLVKSLPARYDVSKYQAWQYKARSKDGTMVPYFVVGPKSLKRDGSSPALLTAYGGFEAPYTPSYLSALIPTWLERSGVFVLGNIRGGGEFGPGWHQAGMKEKRQNVYDDFYAVSQDLIARKISSPRHLGILGGSNGGLLVGVAFTQRPELYRAVVCLVPVLDMQRFNKLLAGASWMGEYGNPDLPEEWNYMKKYSPYHNLKDGVKYPEVLFTAATTDDRVHPGHARKMAAKMEEMGHKVYYYEITEGGHTGSTTNAQLAKMPALEFTFLLMKLR